MLSTGGINHVDLVRSVTDRQDSAIGHWVEGVMSVLQVTFSFQQKDGRRTLNRKPESGNPEKGRTNEVTQEGTRERSL
ncbi:MAG: hypothetical protein CMI08_19225 [Oceanospirillaceae bacterium]|nr:hypothetical protein [Oceanospirillaceae bacterium]MAY01297.1 hypothetical protein [Oceanospirillaceae bacterium]MBL35519.1 hypothetical protein [Oceanospirillaceae bacterium]MBS53247.1 hypothetical protein [Oceanospirillaceae bacterium]|tara:strand:+ start:523 stop:756 length:234 start_codon:yes stop_codon:yes gene_type:complete